MNSLAIVKIPFSSCCGGLKCLSQVRKSVAYREDWGVDHYTASSTWTLTVSSEQSTSWRLNQHWQFHAGSCGISNSVIHYNCGHTSTVYLHFYFFAQFQYPSSILNAHNRGGCSISKDHNIVGKDGISVSRHEKRQIKRARVLRCTTQDLVELV